jgi:autophagy-related protein 18
LDEGRATEGQVLAGSPPQDDGWFGYINTALTAGSAYLPSTVTETLLQGRAFASVHLNQLGSRNICALAVIRRSLRLLVCSSEGFLHLYSLDQAEGGDCSLIRQFPLAEEVVVPGSVGEEKEETEEQGEQPEISYSDTVKNRTNGEMTESERFHEMSTASESPPKTAFLLDDDGEFPPVAFAAS